MKILLIILSFAYTTANAQEMPTNPHSLYNLAAQETHAVLNGQAGEICVQTTSLTQDTNGKTSCLELAYKIMNNSIQIMMINLSEPSMPYFYISDENLVNQMWDSYEVWYEESMARCESDSLQRFSCLIKEYKLRILDLIPQIEAQAEQRLEP